MKAISFQDLHSAAATVPPGAWAVGVSGGADSVALLRLLALRGDLRLHVVHLDHELRGAESEADAAFTRALAEQLSIPCTIARASDSASPSLYPGRGPGGGFDEPRPDDGTLSFALPPTPSRSTRRGSQIKLPNNIEARGRALRRTLYANAVTSFQLDGVILGHHADDQAETVFMRLLRGSSLWTMRGMAVDSRSETLRVLRPLLQQRRARLRAYLESIGQPWREDASNHSMMFTRNRVRRLLGLHPELFCRAMELAQDARTMCDWLDTAAAPLPEVFRARELSDQPTIVARWSAVRWLAARGAPPEECSAAVADRLIDMCRDAASPPRQHFPGGIEVRRRARLISAMRVGALIAPVA